MEAFAYLYDISIGTMKLTPDTVEVVPFLQRELPNVGIAVNPRKTVAVPPKGHVATPGDNFFLDGIEVRMAERGGMKVVIGTNA